MPAGEGAMLAPFAKAIAERAQLVAAHARAEGEDDAEAEAAPEAMAADSAYPG